MSNFLNRKSGHLLVFASGVVAPAFCEKSIALKIAVINIKHVDSSGHTRGHVRVRPTFIWRIIVTTIHHCVACHCGTMLINMACESEKPSKETFSGSKNEYYKVSN